MFIGRGEWHAIGDKCPTTRVVRTKGLKDRNLELPVSQGCKSRWIRPFINLLIFSFSFFLSFTLIASFSLLSGTTGRQTEQCWFKGRRPCMQKGAVSLLILSWWKERGDFRKTASASNAPWTPPQVMSFHMIKFASVIFFLMSAKKSLNSFHDSLLVSFSPKHHSFRL